MIDGVDTARVAGIIPLTERETEIASVLSEGLTNAEIAERLGISFATAKWHVSQVLAKLGATRSEAAARELRGTVAATFSLPDARDPSLSHDLLRLRGTPVVLWWFANWCTRCGAAVPEIERLARERPDVVFLAVSLDETPDEALAFAEANGLTIPIAMDSTFSAASDYAVIAGSTAVAVEPEGRFYDFALFVPWEKYGLENIVSAFPRSR